MSFTVSSINQESFTVADMKGTLIQQKSSPAGESYNMLCIFYARGRKISHAKILAKISPRCQDFLLAFIGQVPSILIWSNFPSADQNFLTFIFVYCDLIILYVSCRKANPTSAGGRMNTTEAPSHEETSKHPSQAVWPVSLYANKLQIISWLKYHGGSLLKLEKCAGYSYAFFSSEI